MSALDDLAAHILGLERRIEQLDRRLNNTIREAKVTEVDAQKGLAKVEAHGLNSAWSPWLERAGKIRTWSPPTKGERVVLLSPTGEPGQGLILRGGYSDEFPQPHDKPAEDLIAIGNASILVKDGEIRLKVGDATHIIKANDIELKVGGNIAAVSSGRVETVGATYLGLDGRGGNGPNVLTDGGSAIRTYAKV